MQLCMHKASSVRAAGDHTRCKNHCSHQHSSCKPRDTNIPTEESRPSPFEVLYQPSLHQCDCIRTDFGSVIALQLCKISYLFKVLDHLDVTPIAAVEPQKPRPRSFHTQFFVLMLKPVRFGALLLLSQSVATSTHSFLNASTLD